MKNILIFLVLSLPILIFSWRSIFQFKNHGFYRFLSWECLLWMAINTVPVWFNNFLSPYQLISWLLLIISLYFLFASVTTMKKAGKASSAREDATLYAFEKTTTLIQVGVFKYIRHPMYSSLLFLTWGMFFKLPGIPMLAVAVASTAFLYLTARMEEYEDIEYFGEQYKEYRKDTKMFIPYIF